MLVSYLRGFLLRNTSLLKMSTSGSSAFPKPIEGSIREKLTKDFTPYHLEIINESYMHSVPKGSETHFKVVIVSDKFDKLSLIQRHRLVNESLNYELKNGVHALSIVAKTSSQWENSTKEVEKSPACKGGFGK